MVTTQPEVFEVERVHPFDGHRQPVLLAHPDEIAVGDWLRDLGTFRQVLRLERLSGNPGAGPATIVYFVPQPGVPDLALGITWSVAVTVWRDLARPELAPPPGKPSPL